MKRLIGIATAAFSYWRIIAAVVGVIGLAAVWWQYRAALIEQGRAECQAKVQRAIEQQQRIAEENALIMRREQSKRSEEYEDDKRELRDQVPAGSTDCDFSDDTRRLLQRGIDRANAARE